MPDPTADLMGWLKATGDDGWVTTAEAAELLGFTPQRLCWLRRHGLAPVNVAAKISPALILWAHRGVTAWAAERGAQGPAASRVQLSIRAPTA